MPCEAPNPKLIGSNIVDVIPQKGPCPRSCPQCFYNRGFWRTLDEPLLVTPEEAVGKIVRVNTGHDSNIQRGLVLEKTAIYEHRFYNTSIPRFNFCGYPVVFTCNGHKLILAPNPPVNLMFVRFRLATNNLTEADRAVEHYWVKHGIPVVMTFMRYFDKDAVPDLEQYEFRQHIINSYWMIKPEIVIQIMSRWSRATPPRLDGLGEANPPISGVRMCGTLNSSLCVDCRNCELLYWDCLRRMKR